MSKQTKRTTTKSSSGGEEKESGKIYDEYFKLTEKYKKEYGNDTVVLMQVGAFFEIYGLIKSTDAADADDGDDDFDGGCISAEPEYDQTVSPIVKTTQICSLNIAEKKMMFKNQPVVMAGVRDYSLDRYLQILTDAGMTAVVYVQEKNEKNTRRIFQSIHSPGTYIPFDVDSSPKITNNIMCIWFDLHTQKSGSGTGGFILRKNLVCGVAVVNTFTGKSSIFEYCVPYFQNPTTYDELERHIAVHQPSEVIIVSSFDKNEIENAIQYSGLKTKCLHKIDSRTNEKAINCEKQKYTSHVLTKFYGDEAFHICQEFQTNPIATQSFCFLLNFIQEHSNDLTRKINIPVFNNTTDRVILANHTLNQLNIIDDGVAAASGGSGDNTPYSSVLSFLNKCCSPMGRRRFQNQILNPTTDREWLETEYHQTGILLKQYNVIVPLRKMIQSIKDIEKITRQIITKKLRPISIYNLCKTAGLVQKIRNLLSSAGIPPELFHYCWDIDADAADDATNPETKFAELDKLISFISQRIILDKCKGVQPIEESIICEGVSSTLDEYHKTQRDHFRLLENIKNTLNEIIYKEDTRGAATGTGASITEYIKIHETDKSGLSFQITKKRASSLKACLGKMTQASLSVDATTTVSIKEIKITSATTSNDEIEFPLLNKICRELHTLKEKISKETQKLFLEFIQELEDKWFQCLEDTAGFIAKIDVLQCKAYIAHEYNYCRPAIAAPGGAATPASFVRAKGLRHCLIEHIQQNETYVPNDVSLGGGGGTGAGGEAPSGILIYGVNTSGKTSLIRAVGIAIIMAQSGMYVPCQEFIYYPYTAIFSRILGNDDLFKGLSTFAVEMSELRTILKMADQNSIIIGDELCSGTETQSAISIFIAGIMDLYNKNASFLFATHLHEIVHYDEIQEMSRRLHIKHLSIYYDNENDCIVYDRTLKDGSGSSNYGLMVCRSLYMPADFLESAHAIRTKYFPETNGELSRATTRYNAKKVKSICELCRQQMGEDTHHIREQSEADERGYIMDAGFHKNHMGNLVVLCEKCHGQIHSPANSGRKLKRTKTTKGYAILPAPI